MKLVSTIYSLKLLILRLRFENGTYIFPHVLVLLVLDVPYLLLASFKDQEVCSFHFLFQIFFLSIVGNFLDAWAAVILVEDCIMFSLYSYPWVFQHFKFPPRTVMFWLLQIPQSDFVEKKFHKVGLWNFLVCGKSLWNLRKNSTNFFGLWKMKFHKLFPQT